MNPVSAGTNQLKGKYYSTNQFFTGGGTARDWLTGQSFSDQYEFGLDVLRRIENDFRCRDRRPGRDRAACQVQGPCRGMG